MIFALVAAYVLHNSIFKFPFAWLSLCEASTPFVNYRRAQRLQSRQAHMATCAGRVLGLPSLCGVHQQGHTVGSVAMSDAASSHTQCGMQRQLRALWIACAGATVS